MRFYSSKLENDSPKPTKLKKLLSFQNTKNSSWHFRLIETGNDSKNRGDSSNTEIFHKKSDMTHQKTEMTHRKLTFQNDSNWTNQKSKMSHQKPKMTHRRPHDHKPKKWTSTLAVSKKQKTFLVFQIKWKWVIKNLKWAKNKN